ncbi:hypothetical protein KOR34_46950 [Posidoniimonas corsicana]|uniref:TadE-like protein n=2 Tax=Posidoniimonas corsicana TaxID=1938618 RepID=A0A5C5UZQ3_9BACT|nr:hypothetical protein KOR34_46950 [Posidoniimonas corsicana]
MLLVVFALLDLGVAAVRDNTLSKAGRQVAREAVMSSRFAPAGVPSWGPATYSGVLDDGQIAPLVAGTPLPLLSADEVAVTVEWIDGDNAPGDRVRVTLAYDHAPLLGSLLPWGQTALRSETTMCITH